MNSRVDDQLAYLLSMFLRSEFYLWILQEWHDEVEISNVQIQSTKTDGGIDKPALSVVEPDIYVTGNKIAEAEVCPKPLNDAAPISFADPFFCSWTGYRHLISLFS